MALAALVLITSCDSFVYEDEGDCSVRYCLRFRYDMNLKFADAFAREVTSIKLFAFDSEDRLVWQAEESGEALAAGDYAMDLPLEPGKYRLVAWCGLGDEKSFSLPGAGQAVSPEDLHCRMNVVSDRRDAAVSDKDLRPLFHGMVDVELPVDDDGGEHYFEMPLTKDTNVFRVVLQHLSGEDIDPEDFEFTIEDDNAWLAHDNSMFRSEPVEYRPWALYSGEAGVGSSADVITSVKVAVAEFTVNRLFMRDWTEFRRPTLTIRVAGSGKFVASVPVIDYALLVKGEHNREMDDQEYLDRADEYNMTFFLDNNYDWKSTVIQVLSWRVVVNNTDLD